MLFIEYDVDSSGQVELVGLINAVESEGKDPHGEAWLSWRRREFDDAGLGCAPVAPADLTLMEAAGGPDDLRAVVERIVLNDRSAKEQEPA